MFQPKITSFDTWAIPIMYNDGWRLITIYEWRMYWEKEVKQPRNTKELELSWFEAWYKIYPSFASDKDKDDNSETLISKL
jgi:hypothetical protein